MRIARWAAEWENAARWLRDAESYDTWALCESGWGGAPPPHSPTRPPIYPVSPIYPIFPFARLPNNPFPQLPFRVTYPYMGRLVGRWGAGVGGADEYTHLRYLSSYQPTHLPTYPSAHRWGEWVDGADGLG